MEQSPDKPRQLLTIEEVATWLKIPVSRLYQWRQNNKGPAVIKVGHSVRYDINTVQAWLDAQVVI
jgi:excisionase family DNA binding protein